MSLVTVRRSADIEMLAGLKLASGRHVECARLGRKMTQRQLAKHTGVSVRWIRELEAGNPAVALEVHLKCAAGLDLPVGIVVLPILLASLGCELPPDFAVHEFADLEQRFVQFVARRLPSRKQRWP